ncbi:MAG: dihydrofolate reductase family protein [Pyrinomonadaceae bacterium]
MISACVYIGASLDGFIARADGDISWLVKFGDNDAIEAYNEFLATIDVIVIGRGTYEKVLTFPQWPYDKPVFVLSRTIKEAPVRLKDKASVLALKPSDVLKRLSDEGFSAAYIDGGKVIQSFLAEDLIDSLIIATVPVLIGSGLPLFGPLDRDICFDHVQTRTYSNGLVRSYYQRNRVI